MGSIKEKVAKVLAVWRSVGFRGFSAKFRVRVWAAHEARSYCHWVAASKRLSAIIRAEQERAIRGFLKRPLISVVMPVYNTDERWLRRCIESVLRQTYDNWELCIADDHSSLPHIVPTLLEYARIDKRIKVNLREENGHISAASNSALQLAEGEFTVLLDHDDELSADALFWVANEILSFPATDMIFSDEDLIDHVGRRFGPKFKPDWSRDLVYSLNLVTHLSAYRTELLRKIGGFRLGFEGSQDYDLALRVIDEIPEDHIRHIPRILYHWRAVPGSFAFSAEEKPYAQERARDAIRSHFERTRVKALVSAGPDNLHRVTYATPETPPTVSIIIFGCDEKRSNARHLFVDEAKGFDADICFAAAIGDGTRLAKSLNESAFGSHGDVLCFLNAALSPLSPDWLDELTSLAYQGDIGVVGAKIVDRWFRVVHGGYILGTRETISNAHQGVPREWAGNMSRNVMISNFSAVSVDCMFIRRSLFVDVNGFDSTNLPDRYFDVDLCQKVREKGQRIVLDSHVEFIKMQKNYRLNCTEELSAADVCYLKTKWPKTFERDPFYNPNLSKNDGSFSIAEPLPVTFTPARPQKS